MEWRGKLVSAAIEGKLLLHGGHVGVGFEGGGVFAEDVKAEVESWAGEAREGRAAVGTGIFLAGEEGPEGFEEWEEERDECEGEDGGGMVRHEGTLLSRRYLEYHPWATKAIYSLLP